MDNQGPYVNDKKIADLHLYEEQKLLYLFDFGDEWEFIVDVVKITEGKECIQVCIQQRKGNLQTSMRDNNNSVILISK